MPTFRSADQAAERIASSKAQPRPRFPHLDTHAAQQHFLGRCPYYLVYVYNEKELTMIHQPCLQNLARDLRTELHITTSIGDRMSAEVETTHHTPEISNRLGFILGGKVLKRKLWSMSAPAVLGSS